MILADVNGGEVVAAAISQESSLEMGIVVEEATEEEGGTGLGR